VNVVAQAVEFTKLQSLLAALLTLAGASAT